MGIFKGVGGAILAVILVVAVIVGIGFLSLGLRNLFAEPTGRTEAKEQVFDGTNIIASYKVFFDECNAIHGNEVNVINMVTTQDLTDPVVKATLTGMVNSLNRDIAAYNGKAAATEYGAGKFRDARLPYSIPDVVPPYESLSPVTCQ